MTFLIQQTLIYAVPLMIVALAGVFAERSGIINLALEGIMIFGAFIGVLFVRTMQGSEVFTAAAAAGDYATLQGLELMAMVVAALMGAIFSLLLSFASINLRADQTIGGTALNLLAPALVLFLIRIIATIVYLSAFSLVIKMLISGRRKRKGKHTIPVAAPDGGGNPPSTSEAEKGGEGA